ILGMALLDFKDMLEVGIETAMAGISTYALAVGFISAFIVGCIACKMMIELVKKGKMIWFSIYCAIVGVSVLVWQLLM
ncbi:MAG: undecaprenyl-diphosphate phosphatase, partial [Bacteroidaceae bacterium]|nr:undecaprenyl-diphosphate phosphatase [Bacteroidaceae bacterium]